MREYVVKGQNQTVAAGITLVIINPPAARAIEIVRCTIGIEGVSSAQATFGVELSLKATAFGTYVSTTPQKTKTSDPASLIAGATTGAAATSGINATAEGGGARTLVYPGTVNPQVEWIWTPQIAAGESIIVSGADSLAFIMAIRTGVTPTTLTGWNYEVVYRENS